MSHYAASDKTYHKVEVDNPICQRRFHIAFEQGIRPETEVRAVCPHCGVTVFEASCHPPVVLTRDENLIHSPDGSRPMVYECKFIAK